MSNFRRHKKLENREEDGEKAWERERERGHKQCAETHQNSEIDEPKKGTTTDVVLSHPLYYAERQNLYLELR